MEDIIAIVGIFVAFPIILFHYITKWKTAKTLTGSDEKLLDDLYELSRRLDDRMGTAQVAHLQAALDTAGAAPISSYRAGDIAYWPAEQSLIVFLADGSAVPSDGLVGVGRVTSGIDHLIGCARDCRLRAST